MTVLRRLTGALAVGVLSLGSLAACSGDDATPSANSSADADGDDEVTPEEVLAYAKEQLDDTSGVELTLSTDDTPDTDAYLKAARGTIVADPPSFEGSADGSFMGFTATEVGVVAVDGDFYLNVPITGWDEFDPDDLCAPDPATLLDPETGVSSVLTAAEDVEEGDTERSAADNEEIVTTYTATVPGDAVTNILPCAPGDSFDATFAITSDGKLRSADVTGEFFGGGGDITYTIDITGYDVTKDITKP